MKNLPNLVFFGIQGSGKGTQGAIVAKKFGMKIFETGGALREIIASGTTLGKKVKEIIERGDLVDNDIVMAVISEFLDNCGDELVLFDGIPRSMSQKESFDALLLEKGRKFVGILIDISEEEAKKRLLGRRLCSNCKKVFASNFEGDSCDDCGSELIRRSDDNEEAILKRIENFEKETMPAIKKYEEEGLLLRINGMQSIDEVSREIENVLTSL